MSEVMARLREAINGHDVDAFVALFDPDYRSEQPAHPARAFQGADQVRENWTSVFSGIPDITAKLLVSATTDEGVEVGEWHWHGTHLDGSPFSMRGVIVVGVNDGRIAWGRLYMEPVEEGGADIGRMVQETYRPADAAVDT
jgi:ketosteroid isomerase-like protein